MALSSASSISGGARLKVSAVRPARTTRCARLVVRAQDVVYRALSANKEVAVLVTDATELVSEGVTRHRCAPTAAAALGRALIGTLLMGCFKKEGDNTQITFNGNGTLGQLMTVGTHDGVVKGRLSNPAADPPLRPDGKLNVGAAVGDGVLTVVRSNPMVPNPYTGVVPIGTGEIAEDIAQYLADSEQTNTALALGVTIDRNAAVQHAGGYMIEVLPFASEETLAALEGNLSVLPTITEMLKNDMSVEEIANALMMGIGISTEDATSLEPKYGPCEAEALKVRMASAVALLGKEEVDDIIKEQGEIEVRCDFCNQAYSFSEDDIAEYL